MPVIYDRNNFGFSIDGKAGRHKPGDLAEWPEGASVWTDLPMTAWKQSIKEVNWQQAYHSTCDKLVTDLPVYHTLSIVLDNTRGMSLAELIMWSLPWKFYRHSW